MGKRPVIDLEMKSKTHNFLSNGIAVGNSHSLAYSILAMRTLYLKAHYPVEFFCAFMSGLKRNKQGYERLRAYAGNAKHFGIEILPADVRTSNVEFTICESEDNDPTRRTIRMGLAHVKGLGKAAQKIVDMRPYHSFEDFLAKVRPTKTVFLALLHAGALDNLTPEQHMHMKEGFYYEWCKHVSKGVGKKLYGAFLNTLWGPVQKKPAKNAPQDAVDIFEVSSSVQTKKRPAKEKAALMKDFVTNCLDAMPDPDYVDALDEMPETSESSLPMETPSPSAAAVFQVEFRDNIDGSQDASDTEDDNQARRPGARKMVPLKEFEEWATKRWRNDPAVIDDPARFDEAMAMVRASVPVASWNGDWITANRENYYSEDYMLPMKLMMAEAVYGCKMPFAHPMHYVKWTKRFIQNYGELLPNGVDLQDRIDGLVIKVETTRMYPAPGEENKKDPQMRGGHTRVLIDDGYDQAWVMIWRSVWSGQKLPQKLVGVDGKPVMKMGPDGVEREIVMNRVAPCEVVVKGRCVRLCVRKDPKYGFQLMSDIPAPAQLIPMKRQFETHLSSKHP